MSQQLINRSPDLKRLHTDGYNIDIQDGCLIVRNVPYVNSRREVARGTIMSPLELAGDITTKPNDHTVMFGDDMPCDEHGNPLNADAGTMDGPRLPNGNTRHRRLSRKPEGGYADYYEKVTAYIAYVSTAAQSIDPNADARGHQQPISEQEEPAFQYANNAIARAGIVAETERLTSGPIAIVGLGGTGAYILDLVAKVPLPAIHLFDGDVMSQHNAFRAPGAMSLEEINARPNKAEYYQRVYSKMKRNIHAHGAIDESNVNLLKQMEFVFIAIDHGASRQLISESLMGFRVPFIDVGMGVLKENSTLFGQLRVTSWDPNKSQGNAPDIPTSDGDDVDDEYALNTQIAELNSLNAALAVIKWKKSVNFYADTKNEGDSCYLINSNYIVNQ